ncbi:MAG: hypothetical protein WBW88_17530, partial [Rhodothermales bacterium]
MNASTALKVIGIVLIAAGADQAAAQTDSLQTVAGSQFLRFVQDPSDATLSFLVTPAEGRTATGPHPIELLVDGRRMKGLADDQVSVEVDTITPRAISVTWTPKDGLDHEFDLRLQSTYSTAYYGTGERFQALDHRGFYLPIETDDRADNKG